MIIRTSAVLTLFTAMAGGSPGSHQANGPEPCSAAGIQEQFPLVVGKVDASVVAAAETVLRSIPDRANDFDVANDSGYQIAARRMRTRIGTTAGGALLAILTRPGPANPDLWYRAAAMYVALDLPPAPLEALLLSENLDDGRKLVAFSALKEIEAPLIRPSLSPRRQGSARPLALGYGRQAFLCRLSMHVTEQSTPPERESGRIAAAAVGAIRDEARAGSKGAQAVLRDPSVAAAVRVLEGQGFLPRH